MTEYISRDAVLDEINKIGVTAFNDYSDYSNLYDFVASMPTEFIDTDIVESSFIVKGE